MGNYIGKIRFFSVLGAINPHPWTDQGEIWQGGALAVIWPCVKTRLPHASPSCVVTGRGNPNWLLPSRLALVNRSPTQLVASSNRRRHITPFGIYAEWTRARRHGHTGTGLTQRTSAVYVIWWWWWLSWKGAIVAINHHSGSTLQPRYNARR